MSETMSGEEEIKKIVDDCLSKHKENLNSEVPEKDELVKDLTEKAEELKDYLTEVANYTTFSKPLLKILSEGGFVYSWVKNVLPESRFDIKLNDRCFSFPMTKIGCNRFELPSGKYRFTILIERVGDYEGGENRL